MPQPVWMRPDGPALPPEAYAAELLKASRFGLLDDENRPIVAWKLPVKGICAGDTLTVELSFDGLRLQEGDTVMAVHRPEPRPWFWKRLFRPWRSGGRLK